MFGGVAAAGTDRIVYATFNGNVVTFDAGSGEIQGQFTVYPSGPEQVHISGCAIDTDGLVLLGDSRARRVRRFSADGRAHGLFGALPIPGLENQDEGGTLEEPCALLPLPDQLVVACGGFGVEHGVQSFAADRSYRASFDAPEEGWKRAQGLAPVGDTIWVAETEGGRIRRHGLDGSYLGEVDLHPDLKQPFRLVADGYGGILMLLAPESEEEQDLFGVARLDEAGAFGGWTVRAGEDAGRVYCPFDIAVLRDGRFVVADLPLGKPPEARLQLFSADGRAIRTLVEDSIEFHDAQRTFFEALLAREDRDAATLYGQARVHHFYAGSTPDHLEEADGLYRAAIEAEPSYYLAHLGRGALLQGGLDDPKGAEEEYAAALAAGGEKDDLCARMAECRRAAGDLDGAIEMLQRAIDAKPPPEDYHDRIEDLGSYYLERAGETPDAMI